MEKEDVKVGLMAIIRRNQSKEGESCKPLLAYATELRCSRKAVRNAIDELLKDKSIIAKTRWQGKNKHLALKENKSVQKRV